MSARCEDYPCCGHEPGGCPEKDSEGNDRYPCVECGAQLPLHAESSICPKCLAKLRQQWQSEEGPWD